MNFVWCMLKFWGKWNRFAIISEKKKNKNSLQNEWMYETLLHTYADTTFHTFYSFSVVLSISLCLSCLVSSSLGCIFHLFFFFFYGRTKYKKAFTTRLYCVVKLLDREHVLCLCKSKWEMRNQQWGMSVPIHTPIFIFISVNKWCAYKYIPKCVNKFLSSSNDCWVLTRKMVGLAMEVWICLWQCT